MKRAILLILLLAFLVEGCTAVSGITSRFTKKPEEQTRQTVQVQRGTLEESVSAPGTVSMPNKKSLTFGISATLKEMKVAEGDTVKKGQVLASLETSSLERTVKQAKTNLDNAKKSLEDARAPYKDSDIAKARVAVANARVAIENAQKDLDNAKKPYSDEDVSQLSAAVRNAQVALDSASTDLSTSQTDWEAKVKDAQDALSNTKDTYRQKVKIYYGLEVNDAELYQDPSIIMAKGATSETLFGWMALHPRPPSQDDIAKEMQTAWDNLIKAGDNLSGLQTQSDKAITNAQNNVVKAQESLAQAQDNLAKTEEAPDALIIELREKQLQLAQATLRDAEADLAKMLAGPDPIDVASKEVQVSNAEGALEQAQINLAKATILAPFDSVITKVGSYNVGDDVGASAVMFEMVDPNTLELNATVDEIDIFQLSMGQEVRIELDSLPQMPLRGTVSKIALTAQRQAGIVSYPVTISITPPRGIQIREGLNASATIVVARRENVLIVPSRAIRTSGRTRVVDVMVDGKPQERTVRVGLTSGQSTEITEGLSEGEVVVLRATSVSTTPQSFRGMQGGGGVIPGGGGFR
ncbi:MAG: HlyD family efflux transporter periplasmic adaptor subunit [Chloroflexi bacterium]|nr:HlyD family efflux transporter periplasmic adaptor subunit [Chloroflexota bacterium]